MEALEDLGALEDLDWGLGRSSARIGPFEPPAAQVLAQNVGSSNLSKMSHRNGSKRWIEQLEQGEPPKWLKTLDRAT